jgi:hypothetical protein
LNDQEDHENDIEAGDDVKGHAKRDAAAARHLILNDVEMMKGDSPVKTFLSSTSPIYACRLRR